MTNTWKVFATLLLSNLALAAWAAEPERGRKYVPAAANGVGALLEVRGVFESKELEDRFIVLYQDPAQGSYSYLTVDGPTTGEDILDLGDVNLAVTFNNDGDLKTVEMWENEIWSTVPELEAKSIKKAARPLPDFDEVPKAREPCDKAIYQDSQWVQGCLTDFFSGCTIEQGTFACCDGGIDPLGYPAPDGQKDYGVPLLTMN